MFKDLGLDAPEQRLAKAKLTSQIAKLIEQRGLTQVAAAKILGIDEPKVTALLRGRLSGLSTERLMRFLIALGSNVEIVVKLRPNTKALGRLRVGTA